MGLVVSVPFYSIFRNRRSADDKRNERVDATCDAVLGCEATANIGRPRQLGLKEMLPDVIDQLAQLRGTLGQMHAAVEAVGNGQSVLASTLQDHVEEDERRFAALGAPGIPNHPRFD